jgi:hypothetical protein
MKVSTLTGDELNRAVALALGHKLVLEPDYIGKIGVPGPIFRWAIATGRFYAYDPAHRFEITEYLPDYAGDIRAAWPLIKAHKIHLRGPNDATRPDGSVVIPVTVWYANIRAETTSFVQNDIDPQIAAMRCFVASVYGDDIELEDT